MLGTSSMRFHLHLRRCHPGFWGHVHGLPKGRPGKLSACINECIASSCFTYQWNHACRKYASKKDVMRQRRSVIRTGSTMVDAGSTLLPGFVFGQVMSTSVGFVKVDIYKPQSVGVVEGRLRQLSPLGSSSSSLTSASINPIPNEEREESNTSSSEDLPPPPSPPAAPGGQQLLCNLRSILKKLGKRVLVGDHVVLGSVDWERGRATVEDVLIRHSELVDPSIANVDHALLVFALADPPFEELQVTKFLVSMEASDLPFTLVLNKADLVPEQEVQKRVNQVRAWGYEPLLVSCESSKGLKQVDEVLRGKTSVVAGPSGAGKSSLINSLRMGRHRPPGSGSGSGSKPGPVIPGHQRSVSLAPSAVQAVLSRSGMEATDKLLAVGSKQKDKEVESPNNQDSEIQNNEAINNSQADVPHAGVPHAGTSDSGDSEGFLVVGEMSRMGRGMHTTTTAKLIRLPGEGLLADTPGFSQPSLSQISSSDLALLFPEFNAIIEQQPCRFSDCAHLLEPGCSVSSQEESLERYPLYIKMLLEIKAREETDIKALQASKLMREGGSKLKTGKGGSIRLEARLDTKKHRSGSRQQSKLGILQSLDD